MNQLKLSAITASGSGIEVRFQRLADRWAHTIAATKGEHLMPLLASHEGGPEDDWPPSPPLQEVHLQEEANKGRLILGVGGAGSARWSLSVEADPDRGRLVFDVACRLSVALSHCGSAYRSMIAGQRGGSLHEVLLPAEAGPIVVSALPSPEHQPADVEITPTGLAILPETTAVAQPASLRWRYAIGIAAEAGKV